MMSVSPDYSLLSCVNDRRSRVAPCRCWSHSQVTHRRRGEGCHAGFQKAHSQFNLKQYKLPQKMQVTYTHFVPPQGHILMGVMTVFSPSSISRRRALAAPHPHSKTCPAWSWSPWFSQLVSLCSAVYGICSSSASFLLHLSSTLFLGPSWTSFMGTLCKDPSGSVNSPRLVPETIIMRLLCLLWVCPMTHCLLRNYVHTAA